MLIAIKTPKGFFHMVPSNYLNCTYMFTLMALRLELETFDTSDHMKTRIKNNASKLDEF
jgi:hypothetical protein